MEQPSQKEKRTSDHYDRVKEFMQKAEQDTPSGLTVPSEEVRILRAKLILEEALETIEKGLGVVVRLYDHIADVPRMLSDTESGYELQFLCGPSVNLEEIADGCADLKVVTTGTLIACGIEDEELQRVVDESNLKKFEPPKCPECGKDMKLINLDLGLEGSGTKWVCADWGAIEAELPIEAGPYRRSDGKHIKPPYWKKPDIAGVIGLET